jgi:hypothetical protein
MAVTTELTTLHRTVDELRSVMADVRSRYGDIPAVRRLLGDIDRLDLDLSELDTMAPPPATGDSAQATPIMHVIDDKPLDPSLWADADDEGLGGHRAASESDRRR